MTTLIRAGVLGWPVSHSLSPRLHGFWLDQYGIDGSYEAIAIEPERFDPEVRALFDQGYAGFNVTIPHKENALAFADVLDDRARLIGAVNTLVKQRDGSVRGENTDWVGFLENIKAARPDWSAASGPAVLLGAGGAARGVAVALVEDGATDIRIVNRTLSRAQQLAASLADYARQKGAKFSVHERADQAVLGDAAFLVNSTSLGMKGQPALEIDLSLLPKKALVNDIVYVPLMTDLLKQATRCGLHSVDGIGMLLHQAAPGFEAWFGVKPEVTAELRDFVLKEITA